MMAWSVSVHGVKFGMTNSGGGGAYAREGGIVACLALDSDTSAIAATRESAVMFWWEAVLSLCAQEVFKSG